MVTSLPDQRLGHHQRSKVRPSGIQLRHSIRICSNTSVVSSYYAEAYLGIVLYLFCLVFFSFFSSSSSFSFFFSFSRFFSQLYLKNYKAPEVETLYTDSPWPLDVPFGSVITKGQRSRSLGVKKVKLLRQPYLK